MDLRMMQAVIHGDRLDKYLKRYQGFWVQKITAGCIKPASTYTCVLGVVNRDLFVMAEQKSGLGHREVNGVIQETGGTTCVKIFSVDAISKQPDLKWTAKTVN